MAEQAETWAFVDDGVRAFDAAHGRMAEAVPA